MHEPWFPAFDHDSMVQTRKALHAYSRVLGAWLRNCRPRRKHWWHAGLSPTIHGVTTGLIHADVDISIELNSSESLVTGQASNGESFIEPLNGQTAAGLAERVKKFMLSLGVDRARVPDPAQFSVNDFPEYSAEHAYVIGRTIRAIHASLDLFRSRIKEETSPILLWPRYFDVAMLWLPGVKIPGTDPENEEVSDTHMQFGFIFADDKIDEPYFYVTAYPTPKAFETMRLPPGAYWQSEGFQGVVAPYRGVLEHSNPKGFLVALWAQALETGQAGFRSCKIDPTSSETI